MNRNRSALILFCLILSFGGRVAAQDAAQVAPHVYKKLFENKKIRLLDTFLMPGEKTPMHSHPALIDVVLEGGQMKWTMPSGQSVFSKKNWTRGKAAYHKSGSHISENVGKTPVHAILVEFKNLPPKGRQAFIAKPGKPHRKKGDSPHATIYRITLAPGQDVPRHTHGDHILISLSNGMGEVTDDKGMKKRLSFRKNRVAYLGPVTHSAKNVGKTSIDLIDIELK